MSGAGAPDFFYREAQRLGYVARSAFKVLYRSFTPSFPTSFYQSKSKVCLFLRACETAASDAEAVQTDNTWFVRSRPRLRPRCLASGIKLEIVSWVSFFLLFDLFFMGFMVLWLYFLVVGGLPEFGSAQKWRGGCGH